MVCRFGKMPVILVGGAALATSGLAFFAYTDAQLGTWALVLPLLAIYGVGRYRVALPLCLHRLTN